MRKFRGALFSGALALVLAPCGAFGQAIYGSIFGTVTDATGAAIPDAPVVVTDVSKGTSVTVKSNSSGDFTVDHLIPDEYKVKVTVQGFKSFEQTGVRVFADTSLKVSPALVIGGTGETIEVNADQVPLLKTDRADVSTTFSSQEIVDLPIPDRNFTNLQLLLPGAQALGWGHAASENPQGSRQIEVDGQAFAGVAFQLDGTDNQDPILGIIVINPNSDSLSETKITTQNFDAEFGKAVSSVITAQTKSGTNKFHGSAFDYRQSNANLARDPFTQGPAQLSAINPFPAGLKNQFGGSIGGPIIKDKFFFFGDYQGVRQKVGISNLQTVPSTLLTTSCLGTTGCDFSEYAAAVKATVCQGQNQPANCNAGPYQLVYNNGTPYANNIIPVGDLSPQALALLKRLQPYAPNNNSGGTYGALASNYAKSGIGGFNSDQWDARLDYTLSARTHLFGRFSRFTDTLTGTTMFGDAGGAGFGLGGYGGSSKGANDSAAAGIDIALNSKLVTDIRAGYFRYNINTSKYNQGVDFATQLGIPGLNTGSAITSGAPEFEVQEVGSFGAPGLPQSKGPQYGAGLNATRCNCPLTEREDQFQLANNWTKTFGNHSVKFGADLRYARNLRVPSDTDRTGVLNFGTGPSGNGTASTGLGFATLLTGKVSSFGRYVSTSTNAKEFQKRDFFYVQDTWRATSALTMNYGVRYEVYFPETLNAPGNGSLLNLATGYNQVAGIGGIGSNMGFSRQPYTFNPRLGVAYQVSPTTVFRAGYGRSFDIGVFGSIFGHAATQNLPVLSSQSITPVGGDNQTNTSYAFLLSQGPTAPGAVTVPSNGLLPNPGNLVSSHARPIDLRLPTLDAWNAAIQQSLTPTLSLNIAYVGNKGTHTLGDTSGQQTNPNEATDFLPAQFSVNGQALHYDPSVRGDLTYPGQTIAGISTNNGTANQTYLTRYYGGKLPACSDAGYAAVGGVNAPNGGCGWTNGIQYYENGLDTHYNALQATLTKQMSHGYSLNVNYAWQQAISDATSYSTWDRRSVRGRDASLRQQQIIAYGLFQLPFGRNKAFLSHANGIINQIVGGIEISPVVTYSSGLPFTLSYSSCANQNVGSAPCYVQGDEHFFHKHITGRPGASLSYYDPITLGGSSGFTAPALDQIGNGGRNNVFGPNFFNTDLSIQKNFDIREGLKFQLRADGFNAFNHINFGNPGGNIESGGGIGGGPFPVGQTGATRQLQFSGRVQF